MEKLKVANCNGLRPVLANIAKSIKLLDSVTFGLNATDSKADIMIARQKLFSVLENEGYHLSSSYRIRKKYIKL